jgi:hypothetical protein
MAPSITTLAAKLRLRAMLAFVVGWEVGGAMMVFNPPPHGFRRAATLPVIGLVAMAAGIYFAFKALQEFRATQNDKPPRHASGAEPSVRPAVRFLLAAVVLPVIGAFCLWDGVRTGQLSLAGLGVCSLSVLPMTIPMAIEVAAGLARRKRRRSPGHSESRETW